MWERSGDVQSATVGKRALEGTTTEILCECEKRVTLSNGDVLYEGTLIVDHKWGLDAKSRRDAEERYRRNGGTGFYVTSWLFEAHSKEDAIKAYEKVTGIEIVQRRSHQ